jgi:hypothetical protein
MKLTKLTELTYPLKFLAVAAQVGAAFFLITGQAHAGGMSYRCDRYVNGVPTGGHVTVVANSNAEAVMLALAKYQAMGYQADYVKCK